MENTGQKKILGSQSYYFEESCPGEPQNHTFSYYHLQEWGIPSSCVNDGDIGVAFYKNQS